MDFAALIPLLRDLSPYVAIALLICGLGAYYVYRKFNLRETFLKTKQSLKEKELESDEKRTQQILLQKVNDVHTLASITQTKLDEHITNAGEVQRETNDVLRSIHRELIRLNAAQPGKTIGHDNAKKIILYQWNWCRDETIRLLINSIINNHYYGNEAHTARKVLNAWKDAAKSAHRSIVTLDGIGYPVDPLFTDQIKHIWERSWEMAVPVYHKFSGRPVEGKQAFEELSYRIHGLFDQVYEAYVNAVEDIDTGLVYRHTDRDQAESEDSLATSFIMATKLQNANAAESTNQTEDTELVRKLVKQSVTEYRGRSKKTKSGLHDPKDKA